MSACNRDCCLRATRGCQAQLPDGSEGSIGSAKRRCNRTERQASNRPTLKKVSSRGGVAMIRATSRVATQPARRAVLQPRLLLATAGLWDASEGTIELGMPRQHLISGRATFNRPAPTIARGQHLASVSDRLAGAVLSCRVDTDSRAHLALLPTVEVRSRLSMAHSQLHSSPVKLLDSLHRRWWWSTSCFSQRPPCTRCRSLMSR